jgi:TIR domain
MCAGQNSSDVVFRAFLSHRYKSPEVNEYFFNIFDAAAANPQFSVDRGTIATSVTRLERLIRSADAFIGIYPFPEDVEVTAERLRNESRYFRLELDLAERAAKPALAFIDSQFGAVIAPPPRIVQIRFRREEIGHHAQSPRSDEFKSRVGDFCRRVSAWRAYNSSLLLEEEKIKVGILLPPQDSFGNGYTSRHIELIEAEIKKSTSPRDVEIFGWPPMLGNLFSRKMEELDWIVVDIGATSALFGIVGYLHGRFVPMMRLMQVSPTIPTDRSRPLVDALFGAYEVGYPKDIVRWSDEAALQAEVERRIKILDAPQTRVATLEEAQRYFRSAALRNEAIFVSYSGRDADEAAELITALKQRFQQVFDYRGEDKPIPAGTSWIAEIFKQLAASPIGVPLFSQSYFESGHCLQEAREMLARRNAGGMKIVPIKLRREGLEMPAEFNEMQYLRSWEHRDPSALVDSIVQSIAG